MATAGGVHVFDGVLRQPESEVTIRGATDSLRCSVQSVFSLLSSYIFRERVPFDGWALCKDMSQPSAIGYVLERTGISPARFQLSNVDYIIGSAGAKDPSGWNMAAEIGDTALDVFQKLVALMADAVYGSHPGPFGMEFWVKTPADLPTEPALTLYGNLEDAMAANPALTEQEAAMLLFDEYKTSNLPLEANEVRVTGVDARTGATIQRFAVDSDSADPELPPSARAANWAGMPLVLGIASTQIRSSGAAERLVEGLLPVVTDQPVIGSFSANTLLCYEDQAGNLLPLWRMDMVRLDGIGTFRVTALEAELSLDYSAWSERTARYSIGTIIGRGGSTLQSIRTAARIRNERRGRQDFGFRITSLTCSDSGEVA